MTEVRNQRSEVRKQRPEVNRRAAECAEFLVFALSTTVEIFRSLRKFFRWLSEKRDLLALRRQKHQVRKFNIFAALPPLREIIRSLLVASPRWDLVIRSVPDLRLLIFGSCALLLALSFPAQSAQRDLQKLTVGYTPISGASIPFFIAVEERIFQKYGFDVAPVFMGGSPLINAAILAGEFPIGYTGGGAIISSRLSGSDLIAIASPLPVLTIDGWAKPEIKSVSDLRGKRVGVTRFGASSYFAGLSMLESAGIKPSEVTFIQNGGVGESYAALLGGRVDVCMIGYPFGLRAKKEGFHLLFRPLDTEYGLFPTAVIGARESWLKDGKNRKFAIDFLRALSEGQRLARENAEVTKKALGKFTRTENDAELQGSFEFYKDAFSSNLRVVEKSMANALKFVEHPKAKGADVKQFYDNSLVDEAMK